VALLKISGRPRVTKTPHFGILNPKSRDFKSRLKGCEICDINGELFSKIDLKTRMTLSLILRFNPRLGGYSIWSASTSRTISEKKFGPRAPHSLDAAEKILRRVIEALEGLQA